MGRAVGSGSGSGSGEELFGVAVVGHDADGGRAPGVDVALVALGQQGVGDRVDARVVASHIGGAGLDDRGLGAVLVGVADPDASLLGLLVRFGLGPRGIGADLRGLDDLGQPGR
ncbi:hypothetical protein OG474_35570 [Kribbella sp. NBC_01505]|uniref:hypothetical protein n=1 Tax=Kribbella sp. NBC_01505 TaxID=2903580 RepID=UPI003866217D